MLLVQLSCVFRVSICICVLRSYLKYYNLINLAFKQVVGEDLFSTYARVCSFVRFIYISLFNRGGSSLALCNVGLVMYNPSTNATENHDPLKIAILRPFKL